MIRMSCGNCGESDFSVFLKRGSQDFPKGLTIRCQKCKSDSEIKVTVPSMEIDWGENAEGILCILGKGEEE